jgi:hypothetical protein
MSESADREVSGMALTSSAQAAAHGGNWCQSKWLAVAELLVVALILVADARHLIPFSKTPFLLALGWLSLWLRNSSGRGIGVSRYRSWRVMLGMGIAAGCLMEALEISKFFVLYAEILD